MKNKNGFVMKGIILLTFCIVLLGTAGAQTNETIKIQVNAAKPITTVTRWFNGTNIEDLNNQTNGGLFSQLLHGEAFQESIDIDFMNLKVGDYVKVYVVLDERGLPNLLTQANIYNRIQWNNLGDKYDVNTKDMYAALPFREPWKIGPLTFNTRFIVYDSIPDAIRTELVKRVQGNEQISRYWNKITKGNVDYRFTLKRGNAYIGRQGQVISFLKGTGECGIYNSGLNKQGINLEAGKPYDGVLRIKSAGANTIYVSLRDSSGKVIAEKPYLLKGNGTFEKVAFELTPTASTPKGSFGISLKKKGEIEMGFAFLQPGKWGRVNGYPIRKQFVDALKTAGIKVIRYNGSMVDVGADTYLYRWKKMLGPVDERRVTFRSGFNTYATHSFGVVELCQFAEAVGAEKVIGLSMDESHEDLHDFVEYMNGAATTQWGKLRTTQGHPAPYNVKYIEVDNERRLNRGYLECVKKFATAAWEVDPEVHIVLSLNIGSNLESYSRGTDQYNLASELYGWFIKQGKGNKMVWDPHYSGSIKFADAKGFTHEMGMDLQAELSKDYPGNTLTLCPLEENGSTADWNRGLAHAHNWNTLQRNGKHFTMLATANTFQPYGQHYMWDQGRFHYTSNEMWFQPSAYIDEKMAADWLPNVIEASSSIDSVLDVTAKMNDTKDSLSIYVANLSDTARQAVINVNDFTFAGTAQTWTIGDCALTELNTVDNKKKVAPKTGVTQFSKDARYTFPRYSYTIITLRK